MGTNRFEISKSSPTTTFYMEFDRIGQSATGNYTTVRMYLSAVNFGNTSSYAGDYGEQVGAIQNVWGNAVHSGNPFMPSGYANGQVRWRDGPWDVNIGHDANGYRSAVTLVMRLTYNGVNDTYTTSFNDFPRIPKRPSAPGTPSFSEILPQSVRVSWAASTDNGGSSIDGYLLRYWPNAAGTGPYTDHSFANNLSRVVSGLTPGAPYRFRVYAHNGSGDNNGYSNASVDAVVTTLAPTRVKLGGIWKYAIPYVKVAGVWKMAQPFVKVAGIWKKTT